MNTELFRYKLRFISILLVLGYAYLHMQIADVYVGTGLEQLIDFKVRLPYGQRLLVPAMAHFFRTIFSFNTSEVFFLLECLFVTLFYWTNYHLLRLTLDENTSRLLNWLFILLLPLVSVINYRFTLDGEANFFYPSDSAALFFTAAGMYLCLRQQWYWFIALIFVATFNRESALLLVFLIPVFYWQQFRQKIKVFALASLSYLVARLTIVWLTSDLPGAFAEWYFRHSHYTHFITNLTWLLREHHLLMFIYCLAGLPLLCFVFHDYIPRKFLPIRYLVLAYFLGLLCVGIFMESRIYHEIMVLLYFPLAIAIVRWLKEEPVTNESPKGMALVDRYLIFVILLFVLLLQKPINDLILFLFPHSH